MCARMLGACGRVVQNGIGEAHVFLLTRAPWAEPNGSVYIMTCLIGMGNLFHSCHFDTEKHNKLSWGGFHIVKTRIISSEDDLNVLKLVLS